MVEGASYSLKGDNAKGKIERGGSYLRIEREWKNGDAVTLQLPMSLRSRVWKENKNSVSLDYGPLTLALRIDEDVQQRDSRDKDMVQNDSHWQEGVDASLWPAYELFPRSPWNYALVVDKQNMPVVAEKTVLGWPQDNYPFTLDAVPFVFTVNACRIPSWGMDQTGMTEVLPSESAQRSNRIERVTLVPMGAARLRIASFPRAVAH